MKSEITSLLIITKLEQYDYPGATAIAVVMLVVSFVMLLLINTLQWYLQRRTSRSASAPVPPAAPRLVPAVATQDGGAR
jgi:sulfate transport system permease protein